MPASRDEFSERLRGVIRESGLSVYRISKLSGVEAGTIYRFLSGERSMCVELFTKLCGIFGMTLGDSTQPSFTEAKRGRPPKALSNSQPTVSKPVQEKTEWWK